MFSIIGDGVVVESRPMVQPAKDFRTMEEIQAEKEWSKVEA